MKPKHSLLWLMPFMAIAISPRADAAIAWTTGTTADATGSWTATSFNGQTYTTGDDLDINGTAAKTVTTTGSITTPNSLTVSSTGATTLTGTSVGGSLAKTNAGALTLSSANTFGTVTISGGKFVLGASAAAGLGTTGTLNVNSGAASGPVGSYGAGSSVFFFDAAAVSSNYSFSKNITFGTVATATTYGLAMKVGTSAAPSTTTLSGNVTAASNVTMWLDVSATATPNFSTWILSGNNSTFAGNIRLNRGNVQFNSLSSMGTGALFLQTNGSDGFTPVSSVVPPSNLIFGFAGTVPNALTLRAGSGNAFSIDTGANNVTLSGTVTISGNVAGDTASNFVKNGAGTLALTGTVDTLLRANATPTTTTPLVQGAVTSGNVSANVAAGTLTFSGMTGTTLTLNTLNGAAGTTVNLGAKTLSVAGPSSGTFAGTLSGTSGSSLTKSGTGTLTLSGPNTVPGSTAVSGGTLRLDYTTNNTNKLPDTTGVTLGSTGFLRFTANAAAATTEVINGLTLSGSGSLALDTAAGQTLTADFSGSGAGVFTTNGNSLFVATTGTGTAQVKLPGTTANTSLGNYVVYNSTFAATDANNYLIATGAVNNTSTALDTWASGATTYTTTGSAFTGTVGTIGIDGITFNDAAANIVAIGGADTLTLSKGIIVSPSVGAFVSTISGGGLQGPVGGALVINNGNSSNLTISSTIIDNGVSSLFKTGSGNVLLSNTNTYAGGTTIDLGTLSATTPAALSSGAITATVTASYGTTYASGTSPFLAITGAGTQVLSNNLVLPAAPSNRYYAIQKSGLGSTLELSGTISGGGANTFFQLDTPNGGDSTTLFILSGTNTLSGQVRLNRGAVTLTNASSLGSADLYVQSNANTTDGNVRFSNSFTLPNKVVIGATASDTFNTNANDVILSGAFTSGATWNKIGAGSLTLSNTNAGAGGINVNAGTLVVSGISSAAGDITIGAATLKVSGTIYADAFSTATLTVGSGGTLELKNWNYDQSAAHTTSLGGLRANNPSLVVNGGTIRMVGTTATSYNRGFSVGAGGATFEAATGANWTLAFDAASHLTVAYTGNPSLTFTGAGIGAFDKVFSGTGGVTKSGSGTWTLSGTNTYSGTTSVNGGTLLVTGTHSGTGAVTVTSGTLGGTGNIAGDVNIGSGTFVAPGTTGTGTLTVASATLTGTYNCQLDVSAADKVAVTGLLTVSPGASIAVSTIGIPTAASYVVASYGTLSGSLPTVTGIPSNYSLDTSTPGQIKLVKSGYSSWVLTFPGLSDPSTGGDPDNDGIRNLLEYVLGGDPRVSSTSTLPVVSGDGSGGLTLVFNRNPDSIADTTLVVEWGTDLGSFPNSITIGTSDVGPAGNNPTVDVDAPVANKVTVNIPAANAVNGKIFARLKASQP